MNKYPEISFENTEYAFAYKSDAALRKAHWLFYAMGRQWLVNLGSRLTPWALKIGLPVKGLIRHTIFSQFVGGETLPETAAIANMLQPFQVGVILDYGVEGKEGEANFDHACEEFIRVVNYAASQPNIPFMSVKVTGLARFGLLEKLDAAAAGKAGGYAGKVYTEVLTETEQREWERVVERMERIAAAAGLHKVAVMIDAEETWVQDPVDALTTRMMEKYNRGRVVIYNTIQLYRHDRLEFLKNSFQQAREQGFIPGFKLVRGAYMEKERERAAEKGYPSPIQPDKTATDSDYNAGVAFCIEHLDELYLIVASHNEYSNLLAAELLQKSGLPPGHPHIHFSQLYGMSDNITFNLAKAGCSVSKYLPFGPIEDVVPYLMRRARENSSVSGQTGRELSLIRKELKRRKAK